jgi:gliding motility-associated protein GldE
LITPAAIITFLEFDPATIVLFVAMVLLLCLSAMMSASETALFSLSPTNMAEVRKKRTRADESIMRLLQVQDYMLATILIANNLVNILIILVANRIIDLLAVFNSGLWEFLIKTVVVTFILLLFGEIMPKIYAAYNPLRCARFISVPLLAFKSVFKPFAYVLIKSSSVVSNSLSRKREGISIDELSNAIEMTRNQTEEERRMLSGIVNFVNTDVERIMKPRMDMVTLDVEDDFDKVREVIIQSGFSRIPVCEESIDNVRGVLYVKDLVAHKDKGADFGWQELLRKPYFVPEHKKINDLLEEFRSTHVHLAIVVDEYGSTVGLVSLEDILEEIVGEISDESDTGQTVGYERLDEYTYLFDGKTHLEEFLKIIGKPENLLDDVRGQAETVAGLMLEVKRDFVRQGESIDVHEMRFTARTVVGRRIDKVRVNLK